MAISAIGSALAAAYTGAVSATSASGTAKSSAATSSSYATTADSSSDKSSETSSTEKSASAKSGESSKASLCPKGNPACISCGECKSSSKSSEADASGQNADTMMKTAIKAYEAQGGYAATI